ncbi:hypothetical protein [Sphingomonas phage Birtae]|nr:hypothetical protein [Sphingomonas phage Birtae]
MPSPRKKKAEASSATAKLSEAFEFVSPAFKEKGQPFEEYCRIGNKQVIAFNGVVAFGHPIDEELTICPHLGKLLTAIKKAGQTLSLTELDSGRLSMKGDNLRVIIPCIDPAVIPAVMPDPPAGVMSDDILAGFAAVNPLIKEGDANIRWIETAALLRANTIFATNGHIAFEYWHGIDLPPGLSVPKMAVNALAKTKKKLTGFGFSRTSVTFYFEDGAWIRTQLFSEQFPDVDRLLNNAFKGRGPADLLETPPALFEACAAVLPFADTSAIYLGPGVVKSHPVDGAGADYPVEGLAGFAVINGEYMKLAAPHAARFDLCPNEDHVIFFGDRIRGVLMKMRG